MLKKSLLKRFFKNVDGNELEVVFWDEEQEVFNENQGDYEPLTVEFKKKIDIKEILKNPQLKLAEAYMDDAIDFEGSYDALFKVVEQNIDKFQEKMNRYLNDEQYNIHKRASEEEKASGVREHYDIGNDFFEIWQDETMTYSCAYFKNKEDDLKKAQVQKNEHILNKLNLEKGEKILDIGCGWGALAIQAAQDYGVEVLGITLSTEQAKEAKQRVKEKNLEDLIEIRRQDFNNLAKENIKFDKIVSVGMFEHVGKNYIPDYFKAVNTMLKEGGLSLLHTITHLKEQPVNPWLSKYIFPWGYIPSLREIVWELPQQDFHLLDVEDIGYHYSLTAQHWLENFEKHKDQIREAFDERFVRMWRIFLLGVVYTFKYYETSVHQLLFSKGKNIELPLTRDYMYENH